MPWLCVAGLNDILVPGMLFEEFVLDIPDDIQHYTSYEENSSANDRLYSNGKVSQLLGEEAGVQNLSATELEEAATANAKPDKNFNLFKEAVSANSYQVQCQI